MRLIDQAATGVRWTLLGTIGTQLLNFGTLAVLARQLGPKAFGIVALAGICTKFLEYFLSQGLGMAIIQRRDLEPAHLNSAFWLTMGMGGLLAGLTVASAPIVSQFFSEPALEQVLQVLSLSFVISGLSSIQTAVMTRERKFKKLAIRSLIGNLTGSSVGIALALSGAGVWALVAKQLAVSAAVSAVLWSTSAWRPALSFSLAHLKELWGFSVNVLGRNIVGFCYLEADKFLIGRLVGAADLGFYSNAKQLARMVVNIARKPVETVALPLLSKLQDDRTKMADAICRSQNMMATMLLPIFFGLAALAPEVVEIIFGPQWEFAKQPLRYLSAAEGINACSAVAFTAIMAIGRPGLSLLHLGISASTAIVATLIGARWGITGVSIGILINSFVYTGAFIAILTTATDVTAWRYFKTNLPAAVSSLAMAACVITTTSLIGQDSHAALRALAGMTAGVASYAVLLRISSPNTFKDAKYIALKATRSNKRVESKQRLD